MTGGSRCSGNKRNSFVLVPGGGEKNGGLWVAEIL